MKEEEIQEADGKLSVQFNEKATVFSDHGLEEVDLIEEDSAVDTLMITDDTPLPMDGFEDLEHPGNSVERAPSPIDFEELPA